MDAFTTTPPASTHPIVTILTTATRTKTYIKQKPVVNINYINLSYTHSVLSLLLHLLLQLLLYLLLLYINKTKGIYDKRKEIKKLLKRKAIKKWKKKRNTTKRKVIKKFEKRMKINDEHDNNSICKWKSNETILIDYYIVVFYFLILYLLFVCFLCKDICHISFIKKETMFCDAKERIKN